MLLVHLDIAFVRAGLTFVSFFKKLISTSIFRSSFIIYMGMQMSSPTLWLVFTLSLSLMYSLNFNEVQLISFLFYG